MTVIRETDWMDGAKFPEFNNILLLAQLHPGRCVMCGREQPDDMKWPYFGFDLESKSDGHEQSIEFCVCPTCEPLMDDVMEKLGALPPPPTGDPT